MKYGEHHFAVPRRSSSMGSTNHKMPDKILTEHESGWHQQIQSRFTEAGKPRNRQTGALKQNPFLVADKRAGGKDDISQQSSHAATREILKKALPNAERKGHGTSHMEDIHDDHDDIHTHHSLGFHDASHISEHLAAGAGRDFAELQAKASETARSRLRKRPGSHVADLKHLKPLTPVQASTKLTTDEYSENPVPSGHPSHKLRHVQSGRLDKGDESSNSEHFAHHRTVNNTTSPAHHHGETRKQHNEISHRARHHDQTGTEEAGKATSRHHVDNRVRRFESAEFWNNATEEARSRVRKQETSAQKQSVHTTREAAHEISENATNAATRKISSLQQKIQEAELMKAQSGNAAQSGGFKTDIPSARMTTPPDWLKHPRKQADQKWVHQKLRHVSSFEPHTAWKSHHPEVQFSPSRSKSSFQERRSPVYLKPPLPISERVKQLDKLQSSNKKIKKTGSEEWLEHLGIGNDFYSSQKLMAQDTHRATEAQKTPMSASEEYLEEFRHQSQHLQERYKEATVQAEAELNRLRVEKSKNHRDRPERAPSDRPTVSGFSTPVQILQPKRFLPSQRREQGTAPGDHEATNFTSGRKEALTRVDKRSDLDLHRPSAVPPPNHECSWKDRYMDLTSEVRQLKAEMSTMGRVETEEHGTACEDSTLGIEGLTIVMHLKNKDDLVINTDLTQESDE
ncbi:hypothetical protein BKA67DRAFT_262670 [Truncatella angustata]|uniref:Uncharacterized protein n=1 Tax=Truncatella angustata TaxID=152316 RepID=A0A9P8UKM8_9PEZI|nr:uncharacterized protein BKA67DRAFT_262670 [Truncatella angustata]KAH6653859.1 hypothetical protein BKA67DRAFT_262670 [Truncatella angustata]